MERNLEHALALARSVREAESALRTATKHRAALDRAAWACSCHPELRERPRPTTKERDDAAREHTLTHQAYKQAVAALLDYLAPCEVKL